MLEESQNFLDFWLRWSWDNFYFALQLLKNMCILFKLLIIVCYGREINCG